MKSPKKVYSEEFRKKFIEDFEQSGMNMVNFSKSRGVPYTTGISWRREVKGSGKLYPQKEWTLFTRAEKQTVEAYLKSGITQKDFALTWGVSYKTLIKWLEKYRSGGFKGLDGYASPKSDDARRGRKISQQVMDEIIRIKSSDPQSGLKYIKQMLSRFKGINVSTGSVKKTLLEAEIPLVKKERNEEDQPTKCEHSNGPCQCNSGNPISQVI